MVDVIDRRPPPRLGPGRIGLLIGAALVALAGLALSAGGGVLVWAHATQRDGAGFYTTDLERFETPTHALTAEVDLGEAPGSREWTLDHPVGTLRIRATGTGEQALFVGIARQSAVDRWLDGVAHERVTEPNFGPFDTDSEVVAGDRQPTPPVGERFWAVSAAGTGTQTVRWESEGGRWAIVVMNADGRAGVAAEVDAAARTGILLPIGLGVGAVGVLLLAGAAVLLFLALRHQVVPTPAEAAPAPVVPSRPGTYPARLDGHLDPGLSRWLWLVKWLLVVPHVVVLFFLWVAFFVLTVAAGFAILFTGRYPRSVFEFNVGVMRWTWRVSFYALSAFGTDRYPPFTLAADDSYPADFTVDHPERLSRGLVLVKWWLLALPHYLVVAVFAGGWSVGWNDAWRVGGGGLIALLAFVAVVVLAFRGRYPEPIFDFVMGMNRWCYRVFAYAALLRDEYPPFRLDSGGTDPGSVPVAPPPPAPDRAGEPVSSTV